jgi:putative DNA primase/helicase
MTGNDLAAAMPEVARALLGEPVQALSTATQWRYGRRGSLAIDVKRGLWCDYEAGTGGGVIALIQRQRGGDVAAALRWLASGPGAIALPEQPCETRRAGVDDRLRIRGALAIWQRARPPADTPVEAYLASRRLSLALLGNAPGDRVRFAPACPFGSGVRHPAMLALLTDMATGEPVGIRRTALTLAGQRACDAAGAKLPHKVLGRAGGAVARLAGATVAPAGLGLCEGLETGLSVVAMTGAVVWACPAGVLAKVPILHGVEQLTIYADNDPPGLLAARATATRWRAAGRQCAIETPARQGADFNDLLKEFSHE